MMTPFMFFDIDYP